MKLLKNILLVLLGILLFVVLAPIGLLTTIILLFIKDARERYSTPASYAYAIAFCIDLLGNVVCGDLLNITLIKKGGYKFGRAGETISSALGKNYLFDKLSETGLFINNFLNKIDKDHTVNAIQEYI